MTRKRAFSGRLDLPQRKKLRIHENEGVVDLESILTRSFNQTKLDTQFVDSSFPCDPLPLDDLTHFYCKMNGKGYISSSYVIQCLFYWIERLGIENNMDFLKKLLLFIDNIEHLSKMHQFSQESLLDLLCNSVKKWKESTYQFLIILLWKLHLLQLISLRKYLIQCSKKNIEYIYRSFKLYNDVNNEYQADCIDFIVFLFGLFIEEDYSDLKNILISLISQDVYDRNVDIPLCIINILLKNSNERVVSNLIPILLEHCISKGNENNNLNDNIEKNELEIQYILTFLPELPPIPNSSKIFMNHFISYYSHSDRMDLLFERILYVLNCKVVNWVLLFVLFSQYKNDSKDNNKIVIDKVLKPLESNISRIFQQDDLNSPANYNDGTKLIQILIILSRYLLHENDESTYSKWFLDWLNNLPGMKSQKKVMKVMLSLLQIDSPYYIAVHIRKGLPGTVSKASRKFVATYVQQGTQRIQSLGYLVSDNDSLENQFFNSNYLARKVLSILHCFRAPRVPLALNTAFLYHTKWYNDHCISLFSDDFSIDLFPYDDCFFNFCFPFKQSGEHKDIESYLSKKRRMLREVLKERGMLDKLESKTKETTQKESSINNFNNSINQKIKTKFIKLFNDWKKSILKENIQNLSWLDSAEESIKMLRSSCSSIDITHPIYKVISHILHCFCSIIELSRKENRIPDYLKDFVETLSKYDTLWNMLSNYIQNLISKHQAIHSIHRNGICYFLVLSSQNQLIWESIIKNVTRTYHLSYIGWLISFLHIVLAISKDSLNEYSFMIQELDFTYHKILFTFSSNVSDKSLTIDYYGNEFNYNEVATTLYLSQQILKNANIKEIHPKVNENLQYFRDWIKYEVLYCVNNKDYNDIYSEYLRYQIFSKWIPDNSPINILNNFFLELLTRNEESTISYFMQIVGVDLIVFVMECSDVNDVPLIITMLDEIIECLHSQNEKTKLIERFLKFIYPIMPVQLLFTNNLVISSSFRISSSAITSISKLFNEYLSPYSQLFKNYSVISSFFRAVNLISNQNQESAKSILESLSNYIEIPILHNYSNFQPLINTRNRSFWQYLEYIKFLPHSIITGEWINNFDFLSSIWLQYPSLCSKYIIQETMIQIIAGNNTISNSVACIIQWMTGIVKLSKTSSTSWKFIIMECQERLIDSFYHSENQHEPFLLSLISEAIKIQPCLLCLFQDNDSLVQCPYRKTNYTPLNQKINLNPLFVWQILKYIKRFDYEKPPWTSQGKRLLSFNFCIILIENAISFATLISKITNEYSLMKEEFGDIIEPLQVITSSNHSISFIKVFSQYLNQILSAFPFLYQNNEYQTLSKIKSPFLNNFWSQLNKIQ